MGGTSMNRKSLWGGVVNKFNKDATNTSNGYVNNAYILSNGNVYESDGYSISEYIPVKPSQSYTLVYGNTLSRPSICFYNSNHEFISGTNYNGSSTINFTTTTNIAYCRLSYANNLSGAVMLNEGSTALPYHPYYEWV